MWKKLTSVSMSLVLAVGLCPGFAYAGDVALQPSTTLLSAQSGDSEAFDNSTTLADGEYSVLDGGFTWEGGTGKANLALEKVIVANGKATGQFTASSKNMTHVYYLGHTGSDAEDTSIYDPDTDKVADGVVAIADQKVEFPVAIGKATDVACRTTAMSNPHWVQYSYTIDAGKLVGEASEAVELAITNNTGMFKAEKATAVENGDSATLTFALSGSGYHWLYKGTYEEAVEAKADIASGIASGEGSGNLIKGYENADHKWEFQMTIPAGETYTPVVAISNSYYEKFVAGENSLERAYYPRQFELDMDAATLVTGDYEFSQSIKVTNNVSMFKPAAEAALHTVGGPNSNNYSATLVLPMDSEAMDMVFVGTPSEAKAAQEEGGDVIAFNSEAKTFTIPVKWVETFGDPTTTVSLTNGEPFVLSFRSARNGDWYGRTATLDEKAGTLVFDPWRLASIIDKYETVEGVKAAIEDGSLVVTPELVDDVIAAIQVQVRDEKTDFYCASAKVLWDTLSADDKALVEEYDYFGRDTGDASKDDPLNADEIGENEILVVSFGTSFNDSRVATVGGVEKALQAAYPEWSVRRAFTAQIIINHIASRDGEQIDNVQQALDRAVANGVKNLVVQPTHLMHGAEYDELVEALAPYQEKMNILVTEPLLGEVGDDGAVVNDDKIAVAKAVVAEANVPSDTALVLMGHGTSHEANVTYTQMQTVMDQLGYKNVFIGTVEGEPEDTECSVVIDKVKAAGYKNVVLRPLMVVAGDHANNDMADPDDEESWYSQFTASEAFDSVECQIAGLGQIPAVQEIYVEHAAKVAMYRLYNPYSGEHFYTANVIERDNVVDAGWRYEGVGWFAPTLDKTTPVYRMYNSYEPLGDHHYTTSVEERDNLIAAGWTPEGIGWYSAPETGVPVYREYNPNAYPSGLTGAHNYTMNLEEHEYLGTIGWQLEGTAWYGMK